MAERRGRVVCILNALSREAKAPRSSPAVCAPPARGLATPPSALPLPPATPLLPVTAPPSSAPRREPHLKFAFRTQCTFDSLVFIIRFRRRCAGVCITNRAFLRGPHAGEEPPLGSRHGLGRDKQASPSPAAEAGRPAPCPWRTAAPPPPSPVRVGRGQTLVCSVVWNEE